MHPTSYFQVICLLHFLESPLRHMLERWDGYGNNAITTGGPIGNAIKELHMINKETKLPNLKAFVRFGRADFKNEPTGESKSMMRRGNPNARPRHTPGMMELPQLRSNARNTHNSFGAGTWHRCLQLLMLNRGTGLNDTHPLVAHTT